MTKPTPILIGVENDYFERLSGLHGQEHTNRVICLGQELLSRWSKNDPKREALRPALWAACFLHDLARRHDKECQYHGQWAVEEKLPEWHKFFITQGVKEETIPAIVTAVTQHSLPTELDQAHPHWELTALLKDADALDRCRIELNELDPKFLRIPESHDLISIAEKFLWGSREYGFIEKTDLREAWDYLQEKIRKHTAYTVP